ncbi:conjugal transfer protein [Dickeya dadantii]|uniref:type 4 pilus major pilin n=1 Tax=Dickeya dadantii TaxID=204038 RepID=UPI001495CAB0|nr:type 4 pilus major pilin [Dickeya dadantii]NPE55919.1 conjugal transfer protein [Dickeya dadantii]NPE67143.1 conjugal transfer protein [Dickeya dadantii]
MNFMKKGAYQITDSYVGIGIAVALLIFVVWVGTSLLNKKKQVQDTIAYTSILNEVRTMKGLNGYGTIDYVPALIDSKNLSGVTIDGNSIKNKSGGVITVVGNVTGVILTTNSLSKSDCIKAASVLSTSGTATTSINGTSQSGEVLEPTAQTLCADSNTNTVAAITNS